MKTKDEIDFIYEKLSELYPNYSNKKPKAKIYSKAYTSLIGVMLSAQSQDKRTAIAKQVFSRQTRSVGGKKFPNTTRKTQHDC